MNEKCCGNCAAWVQTNEAQGECHLTPPQVIFMGFQQPKLAGQPPVPMIAGVFPACGAASHCRQWTARPEHNDTIDEGDLSLGTFGAPTKPLPERAAFRKHTPSRVTGVWMCSNCYAQGDELETTECPHG